MKLELGMAALIGALLSSAVPLESAAQFSIPTRTFGQIQFVSGGIGSDEADYLRNVAKDYSLRLSFAGKAREFVADVAVVVTDSHGAPVFKATAGPLLYLNPPPGKYKVAATFNGVTQTRDAAVPDKGGVELNFTWNTPSGESKPAGDEPMAPRY